MMIRFRTRLSLTVSLIVVLAVSGMAVVVISIYAQRTGALFYHAGVQLNLLAQRNIEYGLNLPRKVMDRVSDQMVVQALLVAELVALSESGGSAEKLGAGEIIHRVSERSAALRGFPLLDEVWVTDEQGRAWLHPGGGPEFNFVEAAARDPQVRPFLGLLEQPFAPPVKQEMGPRALDKAPYQYVGVGGVDAPRIVQVGAGAELINSITADFEVRNVVERFMTGMNFERIAVVDGEGRVIAASGSPRYRGQGVVDADLRRLCMDFLKSGEPFRTALVGRDVGVVSALTPAGGVPLALFIQHQTSVGILLIYQYVLLIAVVGAAAIVLGVVASIILSRGLSQPLEALMRGAKAFGDGNLDYRITLRRNDEFKGVAQSFNHMAASLRRQVALVRRQTADRERLESELRIAAEVQQMLLPKEPPLVPGFRMAGLCRPAKTVGGDFFDFMPMTDGAVGVVLGDATGKGMPAALLTTQCWSMLRTLANDFQEPAELLRRTNRELSRRMGAAYRFVTLFCLRVEPHAGVARYAVAGHNPPLMVLPGDESARRVPCEPAFPLGLSRETVYRENTLVMPPGAALLVFSDGVADARNSQGESFGENRLSRLFAELAGAGLEPEAIAGRISAEVVEFCGKEDVFDDMTMVVLRHGDAEAPAPGNVP